MNPRLISETALLGASLVVAAITPLPRAAAENTTDAIQTVRDIYASDRQAFVAEAMQLTASESADFWPLYREYQAARERLGDGLVKLVLEYADLYPNVPEDRASQLLKDYSKLEREMADQRASYLKKFTRILPASKTLRFAQVEARLDLALRLQLAGVIPLVPVEGRLTGSGTMAIATRPGLPGGVAVQTYELTATVAAIDQTTRKLTLVSPDGIKQTVRVGPEAINFDQIRVGEQLQVRLTEQLVVSVAGENESLGAGAAELVAVAPKGAKPGGVLAETVQVTAMVAAIDVAHRKAVLQFEDGSTRTVTVRPEVDLSKRKVGEKVVIRITEALAIGVEQP